MWRSLCRRAPGVNTEAFVVRQASLCETENTAASATRRPCAKWLIDKILGPMNTNKAYFTFLAFRNFMPISSFTIPHLIESKGFTEKEVMNKITHCVFIFSILTAFAAIFITNVLGKKTICIMDATIELVVYVILMLMGKRAFFLGQLAGSLHGITKSLEVVSKAIMYSKNTTHVASKYRDYTLVKHTAIIASGIFGQEFYFMTRSHQLSIVFSIVSLCVSIVCGSFLPEPDAPKARDSGLFKALAAILKAYTTPVTVFCVLNVISSTLLIATSCYSTYIFIERRKGIDIASNWLGKILYGLFFPIRLVITGIVNVVSPKYGNIAANSGYDKNTIIFGYMDSLARLFAMLPRHYIMDKDFEDRQRALVLFGLLSTTMLLMYLQYRAKTLLYTYALTILCSITSVSCLGISNNGFVKNQDRPIHVFYCINLLASAIVHTSISYFSRKTKATAETRLLYYCYVNILFMVLTLYGFMYL